MSESLPQDPAASVSNIQNNKLAVVTGGTQGIGFAIIEKFLAEGWNIATCARSVHDLNECAAAWKAGYPGRNIIALQADFSDKLAVLGFAQAINNCGLEVEVVVNNAGIFYPGSLAEEPDGNLEKLMEVNVYSAYHLTRALLPAMKERHRGHIFNLCSVASLKAYPSGGSYSITKYALLGFSDNLREELKPEGIRVTALAPGATWSRSWSGSGVPEDRIMKATDVAAMVWAAFSLSQQADVEMIVMRPQHGDL